jgi:hypothetical protein
MSNVEGIQRALLRQVEQLTVERDEARSIAKEFFDFILAKADENRQIWYTENPWLKADK